MKNLQIILVSEKEQLNINNVHLSIIYVQRNEIIHFNFICGMCHEWLLSYLQKIFWFWRYTYNMWN